MYYVYIIQSELDGTFYKGVSSDYKRRLEEHNEGLSRYTSHKRPWRLIHVEEYADKTQALIREKKLKRCKADYFKWLSSQPINILNR